jgi:hypothetical protein
MSPKNYESNTKISMMFDQDDRLKNTVFFREPLHSGSVAVLQMAVARALCASDSHQQRDRKVCECESHNL